MKQRIITGALAGAVFLAFLLLGGAWFNTLVLLLAVIGYYEFVRMNGFKVLQIWSIAGFIGIVYVVFPHDLLPFSLHFSGTEAIWLLTLVLLAATVWTKNKETIDRVALLLIGVVYIGIGFRYLQQTMDMQHGLFWTLLVLCCIVVTDSGAYFTGRAIGKRPLWPAISPKKTVEGTVGGLVISVIVAVIFALSAPALLTIPNAIGIGVAAAIFGQLGDLIESAYKRFRGVKDSGNILPGHGGVLDRCDSWLIVFPVVHILGMLPQ